MLRLHAVPPEEEGRRSVCPAAVVVPHPVLPAVSLVGPYAAADLGETA